MPDVQFAQFGDGGNGGDIFISQTVSSMHLKAQRMGQCSPLAQGCQLSLGLIMAAFGMQVGVVAGVEFDHRRRLSPPPDSRW